MWWQLLVTATLGKALKIIDDLVIDKDLAVKTKAQIQIALIEMGQTVSIKMAELQSKVYNSELKYGNVLQKSWRPSFMWLLLALFVNNTFLFAYFPGWAVYIELSVWQTRFFELVVGLFVGGRTVEKVVNIIKSKEKEK